MTTKTEFSAQERRDIVLSMLRKKKPVTAIARENGLPNATIYRWHDNFLDGSLQRLSSKSSGTHNSREVDRLRAEIDGLKRTIAEITVVNNVLKKDWTDLAEQGTAGRH